MRELNEETERRRQDHDAADADHAAQPDRGDGHGGRGRPTVFLTTHYLEEADVLCDRVFVIDHGVIAAEGTPDELKRRISGDVETLRVADRDGAPRKQR